MANDYTFTLDDIEGFIKAQGNLTQSRDTTVNGETLDLLYRFSDGRPAIGFENRFGEAYVRAYLDPEIEEAWFGHFA